MSRALIEYTRHHTERYIAGRKSIIHALGTEVRQCGEALEHDEDTEDLRVLSDLLMGYARQVAKLVEEIETEEASL